MFCSDVSGLSDKELRERIKALEEEGQSGASNPELDTLNREQTSRLSDDEIISQIRLRASQGKPIGKLAAEARQRGLSF